MKRDSGYYHINVILPLFLTICMPWIVFWIPSSQMGPRISVSITAMLTLTAYRFAIGSSLPKIAYLTRLDWFILGSSLLVFISLVEAVITSSLVERKRLDLARCINHSMRWIAPVIFLVIGFFSLF
jgi:cadmium resistance protein CadD (predicted permease)